MESDKFNSEVNDALKKLAAEQALQALQKPLPDKSNFAASSEGSKLVQFLIKNSNGLIGDTRQSEWVLFLFVIIAMGISFFLFFGGNSTYENLPPPVPSPMPGYKPPD